jgi:hypothetical protein
MASLKSLDNAQTAEKRYIAKRFIYVESGEDVYFFHDCWFYDKGSKIEFRSVDAGDGGGCNQVIDQVRADRDNGIDAYGIVDRDCLKSKAEWDSFFETDNTEFRCSNPLNSEHVHVLRCWEIENYLLHPEVIEAYLAAEFRRSPRSRNQVLAELFDLVCRLILVVAADVFLNSYGQSRLPFGFGQGQNFINIDTSIRNRLVRISPEAEESFDECLEKIAAFGENCDPRSLEHWSSLLRIIDGKRLIAWIKNHYKIQGDPCGHLAVMSRNKLDELLEPELRQLIS